MTSMGLDHSTAFKSLTNRNNVSWEVLSLPEVKLAKRYFRELAAGKMSRETVVEAVAVLLQKSGKEASVAVHMTLFLHSSHPEVEKMMDEEYLFPIAPTCLDSSSISDNDYGWIVLKLGFDPEFLYVSEVIIPAASIETEERQDTTGELLERLKNGDLTILTSRKTKERRDDLVRLAYHDGVHTRYEKEDQLPILGSLRIRIRGLSTVTEEERHAFSDDVFLSTFQNPLMAVKVIVNICVRINDCFLLRKIQVFLDLPVGPDVGDTNMPPDTRLLDYAIFKLLRDCDDTSPLWHFYLTGLPILCSLGFLVLSKLLGIVKILSLAFVRLNALENLLNVIKLFKSLIQPAVEKQEISADLVSEYNSFIGRLLHATYLADKSRTVLKLRQACIILRRIMSAYLEDDTANGTTDQSSVEGLTMLELGLLFIRFPSRREDVRRFLEKQAGDSKWRTFEGIRELSSDVVSLITSCCRIEWEGVAKFVQLLTRYEYIFRPISKL